MMRKDSKAVAPLTDAIKLPLIATGHASVHRLLDHAKDMERDRASLIAALEDIATGGESWKDCARTARSALRTLTAPLTGRGE